MPQVLVIVLIFAGVWSMKRGVQDAKRAVRQSVIDWGNGKAIPESKWGRRAGRATGGLTVHAWRAQKAFRKSAREGFWEGAERAWQRITGDETASPRKRDAARKVGKHANTWRNRRALRKAGRLTGKADASTGAPGHRCYRCGKPATRMADAPNGTGLVHACRECRAEREGNGLCYWHDDKPAVGRISTLPPGAGTPAFPACQACMDFSASRAQQRAEAEAHPAGGTKSEVAQEEATPEITTGKGPAMTAEITVGELLAWAKDQSNDGNVIDQATEIAQQADEQASTALNMADRAQASEFKDDVTGPLGEIADAKQAIADAAKTFQCAADTAMAAIHAATTSLEAHSTLVDAAAGLSGGVSSMANREAYAE